MSFISFVVFSQDQKDVITQTVSRHRPPVPFDVHVSVVADMSSDAFERCAREEISAGALFIFARGYAFDILSKIRLPAPVLPTRFYLSSYIYHLYTARERCGVPHPTLITLPSFDFTREEIDVLEKMLGITLLQDESITPENVTDLEYVCQRLKMLDRLPDAFLSPTTFEETLSKLPIQGVFAYPECNSFLTEYIDDALFQAEHLMRLIQLKEQQRQTLSTILNHSDDPILTLSESGELSFANEPAQKLFKLTGADEARSFWKLIPELGMPGIRKTLSSFENIIDLPINISGRQLSLNSVWLESRRQFVFYFHDLKTMEQTIYSTQRNAKAQNNHARYTLDSILGTSPAIRQLKYYTEQFARYTTSVLICGESGTGKELFAQALHNASARRDAPFVAINCSTLPDNLLESELFGYAPGTFTGGNKKGKLGLFELADGGTVFLDEVSEMNYSAQARMLRVLEEKTIVRLGEHIERPVNIRIVAASNKDLTAMIAEGRFRDDLFHRLNVLTLNIPPLRDRPEDIRPIFSFHFSRYCERAHKQLQVDEDAFRYIEGLNWPGNARQLRNFCERLVVLADGERLDADFVAREYEQAYGTGFIHGSGARNAEIREAGRADHGNCTSRMDHVRSADPEGCAKTASTAFDGHGEELRSTSHAFESFAGGWQTDHGAGALNGRDGSADFSTCISDEERQRREILAALEKTLGKRAEAAAILGINPSTLWRRMKRLHIG